MSTLRTALFLHLSLAAGVLASAGSGPWANGTYYPGNLDGKYQAAVSGANTAGILGFALSDGSPVFRQTTQQQSGGGSNSTSQRITELNLDTSVNYYAIFVNGRTYTGNTVASVNYPKSTVTGTLQGSSATTNTTVNNQLVTQLITNIGTAVVTNTSNSISVVSQLFTNVMTTNEVTTNIVVTNAGPILVTNLSRTTNVVTVSNLETVFITNTNTVNLPPVFLTTTNFQTVTNPSQTTSTLVFSTGIDGAFNAKIKSDRGVFTFKGSGQLTAPGAVISNTQTNTTLDFNVNGLRVSFSGASTVASTTTGGGTNQ